MVPVGGGLPFLYKVKFSLAVRGSAKSSLRDLGRKIQGSFAAVSARPGTVLEVRLGVYTENHNARVVASMKLRDELILSLVEPGLPSSKP